MSNSDDGYESERNYAVNQSDILIRMIWMYENDIFTFFVFIDLFKEY